MPARMHPLALAQHEDFSDAAGAVDVLAAGLQLVLIVALRNSQTPKLARLYLSDSFLNQPARSLNSTEIVC
jgi:hypothetical protein